MSDVLDGVRDHYHATGLTERLKSALRALGPENQRLTPQQLGALDQFHTRGLAATAELAKLMENTYRDVNVALANEFAQISELLGVDGRKVIAYANKHPRVHIMNPGIGVGGHCIPIDPWFLKEVAPYNSKLITTALVINDEMPRHVAENIRRAVAGVSDSRIIALGATYKKNCEDTRESPAIEIVHLLRQDGYNVAHYDPLVPTMGFSSLRKAVEGADLVAVLVAHDAIKHELAEDRDAIERAMRRTRISFFDE